MAYIIADYQHRRDGYEYVCAVGETVEDTWTTTRYYNWNGEAPKPPIQFAKKTDARHILDALKAARLAEWDRNRHYYQEAGRRRPAWKIYKVA